MCCWKCMQTYCVYPKCVKRRVGTSVIKVFYFTCHDFLNDTLYIMESPQKYQFLIASKKHEIRSVKQPVEIVLIDCTSFWRQNEPN